MDSHIMQPSLDSLIPAPDLSEPVTPQPQHATLSGMNIPAISKLQSSRIDNAVDEMTPPPSTQIPSPNRIKTRTPTPTTSHISTPPPTGGAPSQPNERGLSNHFIDPVSLSDINTIPIDELRAKARDMYSALQEAKMSAAHHKLQYHMLAQESAAALERMAVEAKMTQFENEVIQNAEQAKSRATSRNYQMNMEEGTIPVQKDLYNNMCHEIQLLRESNFALEQECDQQQKIILDQESDIARLGDRVTLMRERLEQNREHLQKYRRGAGVQSTPRSTYSTPQRNTLSHPTNQPTHRFAALLEASEVARKESSRASRKSAHTRNTHSLSSLPTTPHRHHQPYPHGPQTVSHHHNHHDHSIYATPSRPPTVPQVPYTAPIPRAAALDTYHRAPFHPGSSNGPPASEGTVSASDRENDSEAETDIIEPEDDDEDDDEEEDRGDAAESRRRADRRIQESHASRAASQMLRPSQAQQAKRASFEGAGMLAQSSSQTQPQQPAPPQSQPLQQGRGAGLKQTRLFGAVRKAGVDRDGTEPPAKRAKTDDRAAVGLGIAGLRG